MNIFAVRFEELKKKRKKKLAEIAYDFIKEAIIYNKFLPGEPLSETMLANLLEMSRTPVREALKELRKEELVDIFPERGTFVKQISIKDIREIFAVRRALECLAVETALNNISKEEIGEMKQQWEKFLEDFKSKKELDLKLVSQMDNQLHKLLIDRSKNDHIKKIIHMLNLRILRYQGLSAKTLGRIDETINQHLEILHYMKKRDLFGLSAVLKKHIEMAVENIVRNYSDEPMV